MDDARNPAQDTQKDINEEISAAASAHGDWQEGYPDRKKVEEDCSLIHVR